MIGVPLMREGEPIGVIGLAMSLVEWDRTKWNAKVPDIQPIKDKCCR